MARISVKNGILLRKVKNGMIVSWVENKTVQRAKLNETAGYIMYNLQKEPAKVSEIIDLIHHKYTEDEKTVKSDILSFVKKGMGKYLQIKS